jgi:hypothetical protein
MGRRPRKLRRRSTICRNVADIGERALRAIAREPCFGTDEKRIRTKNTVVNKNKGSRERYTYSRPRTIVHS